MGGAKSCGYITYDELNETLPQDQMSSEQIEAVMSAISEGGVYLVENAAESGGTCVSETTARAVSLR